MNAEVSTPNAKQDAPKVGFVSLGCPKALTDSELILTQLSAEGYQTSKTFDGADLVIGSRYVPGGTIPKEWGLHRRANRVCRP